jgi:hypothetical protein
VVADDRIETLGQALRGVFGDPVWLKRSAVGVAINLIPYVGVVWVMGYSLTYMRELAWRRSATLPEWQPVEPKLRSGLYAFVVSLVYTLPLSLVLTALLMVAITAGVVGSMATESPWPTAAAMILGFGVLLLLSVAFGALIFPVFVHVGMYDTIQAGFDYRRILERAKTARPAYWTALRRSLALSLGSAFVVGTAMLLALGVGFALAAVLLPAEAMPVVSMLIYPVQIIVGALAGFVSLPVGFANYRLWAGYARVAYDLDSLRAAQSQTASE